MSSSSSLLSHPTLDRERRSRRQQLEAYLTSSSSSLSSLSLPVLDHGWRSCSRGPRYGWCWQEKWNSIFHEKNSYMCQHQSKQTKKNTFHCYKSFTSKTYSSPLIPLYVCCSLLSEPAQLYPAPDASPPSQPFDRLPWTPKESTLSHHPLHEHRVSVSFWNQY